MFKIREAQTEDYEQVLAIYKEIHDLRQQTSPDYFIVTDVPMEKGYYENVLNQVNAKTLLVEDSGEVVAFVMMRKENTPPSNIKKEYTYVFVENFCIRASHKRKGIDQHLFQKVKQYAEKVGAQEIEMDVWEFDQEDIAYYEERLRMKTKSRRLAFKLD